jgi:hypothetical protein
MPVLFLVLVLGRNGRFFIVSAVLKLVGIKIQYTIEKYFNILSEVFLILLIVSFLMLTKVSWYLAHFC